MAVTYSYNTGRPLAPGQAQDTISPSGQVIGGSPNRYYGTNTTPTVTTNNIPTQYQTPELMAFVNSLAMPRGGAVTNARDLGTEAISIPQPPKPVNYTGTILGGNAGLSPTGLLNPDGTIQVPQQADAKAEAGADAGTKSLKQTVEEITSLYKQPESQADIYNQLETQNQLEAKKQAVRNYTGQINAITAQSQADQLSAIGQGRGIPEAIIGGQQAQISREAAIKVLPIQAQLSAAQGDLEQAQSHVDRLFQIYSADSTAKTEYYNKVVEKSYDIFSKAEQRKLDQIAADKKAQQDSLQRDIDYQRDLSKQAIGQGAVFTQISSLRPPVLGSKTYAQDLAKYQKDLAVAGGKIRNVGDEIALANLGISRANLAINQAKLRADLDANSPLDVSKIVNNPNLPATDKNAAVLTSLLKSGKVNAGTKTQIANVLGVINASQSLADARSAGKFKGLGPTQPIVDFITPSALKSKASIENRGYLDAINLKVQQWASGASLTEQQTKQVNRLTPNVKDTDAAVRTKLNNLSNFMLTQAQSQLQSEGITYVPEKVNLFETYDLLKQASPQQKAELKAAGLIQ